MLARAIERLEELLDRLPMDVAKDLRTRIATLRTVVLDQRPPALVLVGRRGAGKSSLVNALFGAKLAELGHVTAQTGRGRWYDYKRDGGAMSILDTRGVQEGSPPAEGDDAKTALDSIALELRSKPADLVVFVGKASEVDAAVDTDLDALERIYEELRRAHRAEPPLIAVVTHCDLLEPKGTVLHGATATADPDYEEKLRHVASAERALGAKIVTRASGCATATSPPWESRRTCRGDPTGRCVRTSDGASTRWQRCSSRHRLLDVGRAELARATRTRAVQDELATTLTKATAAICAGIAAAPIPLADILPLTALQGDWSRPSRGSEAARSTTVGSLEFTAGLGANVGICSSSCAKASAHCSKSPRSAAGPIISATVAFSATMAIGAAARAYSHRRSVARRRKAHLPPAEAGALPSPRCPRAIPRSPPAPGRRRRRRPRSPAHSRIGERRQTRREV